MGVVYKAEDTKLGRPVALKFLAPHLLKDDDGRKRFEREARAAATLDHPNICTVYEIDEADGKTFIALAYLDGQTLSEKIAESPLKLNEALSLAMQLAEGLGAAHEQGIVHRDMKPDNVMLLKGSRGLAKIMDFGLAQLAGTSKLTRDGTTLGTMSYMSPEQAEGSEVDRRSDIWSLGVMLYEMVAGQQPFRGDFDQAVVYSILNEQPEPLTALRTGVPKELERIVGKALAKKPDARYQHVDETLVDLRELKRAEDDPALAAGVGTAMPEKSSTKLSIAFGTAAVVLIAAAAVYWSRKSPEPVRGPAASLQAKPLVVLPGRERSPSFSPDGSQVAFAWRPSGSDNWDIYLQVVGGSSPVQLTDTNANEDYPAWSPDGRSMAFTRVVDDAPAVFFLPPVGGGERKLFQGDRGDSVRGISWSPDAATLAIGFNPADSGDRAYMI